MKININFFYIVDKPYKCWDCGKSFCQSRTLANHQTKTHKQLPIYYAR